MKLSQLMSIIIVIILLVSGASVFAGIINSYNKNGITDSSTNQTNYNSASSTNLLKSNIDHQLLQQTDLKKSVNSVLSGIKNGSIPQSVAYIPNDNPQIGLSNNHVLPYYDSYPAPMGIGDFGLLNQSGTVTPYSFSTSEFIGTLTVNSSNEFYPTVSDQHSYSVQLNTVLNNVTLNGNSSYVFWTQNVALYSAESHTLTLIDNVWNFTGNSMGTDSIIGGNGINTGTFYYDYGPTFNVPEPFTLKLYLSTANENGNTAVSFSYAIYSSTTSTSGTYDTVEFNSTAGTPLGYSAPNAHFLVSGSQLTPLGTLNDAELIIGGPGGGSTATFYSLSGNMSLQYITSTGKVTSVQSAYDYGSDTGETSEGVSVAWTANHGIISNGPSFLYGMWNASSSNTMQTFSGTISPSNSMFFVSSGTSFDPATASWVPLPLNGQYDFVLPAGNYVGNVSLSDYNPNVFALSSNVYSSLSINLFEGLYTPLEAIGNSQLSSISQSGSGISSSPYVLFNNNLVNLSPMYSVYNDYQYPLFFGILLNGTSDYVNINNLGLMHLQSDLSLKETLSVVLDSTSYVSYWGSTLDPAPFLEGLGITSSAVLVYDSHHDLIGNNYFYNGSTQLQIVGGSNNCVWGNHFIDNGSFFATGIQLDGGGNTIYNNYFFGMEFPASSTYNGTFGYQDNAWNIANQSASIVNSFNGYSLYGSIIGTSYQGGNYWWNYNGVKPFDDYYQISNGIGDNVPLVAPNFVTFTGIDVPTYYGMDVNFNGDSVFSMLGTNTITLNLLDGNYQYTVPSINTTYGGASYDYLSTTSYIPSPSSGMLSLSGGQYFIFPYFTPNYLVIFNANNLPSGASWQLTLSNGQSYTSTSSSINFYLTNGTYSWTASATGSSASFGGTFQIEGFPIIQSIYFSTVTINTPLQVVESGLPLGTQWSLDLNGQSYSSSSGSLSMSLKNGNYNFQIPQENGYRPLPASGQFYANGENITLIIQFESPAAQIYGYISGTINPSSGQFHNNPVLPNETVATNATLFSALDPNTGYVWSVMENGNISIFNPSSHSVVKLIQLGSQIFAVDISYNSYTGEMYATADNINTGQSQLYAITTASMSVVGTTNFGLGYDAYFLTSDSLNGMEYVTSEFYGNVSVINGINGQITDTVDLGNVSNVGIPYYYQTDNMVFLPGPGGVFAINPTSNLVSMPIAIGNGHYPIEIAIDSSTNVMYVLGLKGNLSLYNLSNYGLIKNIELGNGYYEGLTVDSQNNMAYVVQSLLPYYGSSYITNISVVSSTGSIVAKIPTFVYTISITYIPSVNSFLLTGFFDEYFMSTPASLPTLHLTVSPQSTSVTVNGKPVSLQSGNFTGTYQPGGYYINATAQGYSSFSDYVYLSSGGTSYLNISLKPLSQYGYLSGNVTPVDAIVIANGIAIPVSNGHFNEALEPGTYYVSVMAQGYQSIVKAVNVSAGKTSYLNENLSAVGDSVNLYGYIQPGNSSLLVDGFIAYVNATGYYSIYVPEGTYTVSVISSGYFPYSSNITLSTSREMNITLQKEPTPTSTLTQNNTKVSGFNVSVFNLTSANGYISISYTATSNGTILISIPFDLLKNATLSEILNSTVYINGVQYKNFTISISSDYTVTLKVFDLSTGDPVVYWKYMPTAVIPPPNNPGSSSMSIYFYLGASAAIVTAVGIGSYLYVNRRKRPKD